MTSKDTGTGPLRMLSMLPPSVDLVPCTMIGETTSPSKHGSESLLVVGSRRLTLVGVDLACSTPSDTMALFVDGRLAAYAPLCQDPDMNKPLQRTKAAYLGPPRPIPQMSAEDRAVMENRFPRIKIQQPAAKQKPKVALRMEYDQRFRVPTRGVEVNRVEVCKVMGFAPIQEMDALLSTLDNLGAIEYEGML